MTSPIDPYLLARIQELQKVVVILCRLVVSDILSPLSAEDRELVAGFVQKHGYDK